MLFALSYADDLLKNHSSELLILLLFLLVVGALLILVPQLLRAHLRKTEIIHQEHMKALENGMPVPTVDEPTKAAGRTVLLVPMVSVICAGTVTCFLAANKSETTDNVFSVSLAVWSVSGVVSLAAITGGVALIGRLASLNTGKSDEELPENPLTHD